EQASGVLCDAKVPIKLKEKFYRTAVRPAILYGTKCWAVKSQHENKVGAAEMRMLRWMCGKTRQDKIRNEAIRERVGVAPIVEKMVENRLRWFGHVERKPVDSAVRRVDQMERRQTIRGRGRPKKTIREVIKKDLKLNDLDRSMIYMSVSSRFSGEDVSAQNQVKASVQRKIRQSIAEEYPGLEPVLDDILPKKSPLIVAKCQNHLNLVLVNNVPLFFSVRDGPYMPTLRLLHLYPNIMKKLQVDRGAIRFVLAGANIMCPGLTSPGGVLDEEVGAECPVAIMAEGKQHALAIGFTKMSAKDIKAINKGIGVDNLHYLNDGLWKMEKLD
ncbi:Malignant T-cell-amplified sequence 1, partial [Glycine soja]